MKEVLEGAERAFLSIPEGFRDRATVIVGNYYLISGKNHGLTSRHGQAWYTRLADNWYRGKQTPLAEYAPRLFDPNTFNVKGMENLQEGPGIIAVNQTNEGPLRGNWFKFVLTHAVSQSRGGKIHAARWVQKEESSNQILQKSPLGIQKTRLSRMGAKSCNTILVTSDAGPRQNIKAVVEMKRHLNQDGLLVVCPEGIDSQALRRGKREAGELIQTLVRKQDIPIYPVGVYFEKGKLCLRFGERIHLPESATDPANGQTFSDCLMVEIAKLLPADKRGVYRKLVPEN